MTIGDAYTLYERGLAALLGRIERGSPAHAELLVFQHRLTENIRQTRLTGDTEQRRADRAGIIVGLNALAHAELATDFSSLCGLFAPTSAGDLQRQRVFISYKHETTPDEPLARAVADALRDTYDVFIDQDLPIGVRWAEQIQAELERSDALIILLSERAVGSATIETELKQAHEQAQQSGKPQILPVRLAYRAPFPYPFSAYLNDRQWAFWDGDQDTPALISALRRALEGAGLPLQSIPEKAGVLQPADPAAVPQPAAMAQPHSRGRATTPLEPPEGTMAVDSQFYIARETDRQAMDYIRQTGVTLTIKGPRQVGKSSLLMRTIDAATAAGKRVAFLDFQFFDRAALASPDLFFRQFCAWLTDTLDLDDRIDEFWSAQLGNSQRCTRYIERYLLKEIDAPLLLAMDEVESMFDADFRSDFFGMLRGWHNSRAVKPAWKRLDLALVTSTEPYQLIANLNQSPFNVGQNIALEDFTAEEAQALNAKHGAPLDPAGERRLYDLLGGHPYLTRRAFYLLVSEPGMSEALFRDAAAERGPFGDHLRYHLLRMDAHPDLITGLLQVMRHGRCNDKKVFWRLHGAGLVRGEEQNAWIRNRLYAEFFGAHLKG